MGTELSMDVAFYLSVDEVFSADDVMVGFPLSTEQRHTLQHGVDDETAEYFREYSFFRVICQSTIVDDAVLGYTRKITFTTPW